MGVSQYDIMVIYLYGDGIVFVYVLTIFSISFLISNNRRRTDNTMAKKKVQKDKQRSTKHTHKTKD
jgi:hypothetical protein